MGKRGVLHLVLDISTKFNLHRVKKCTQIMGREESDDLAASQIFYPVIILLADCITPKTM